MSSSSLDIMESEPNGLLVEVTLQSLSGLKCNLAPTSSSVMMPPNVTASVSFAGSASDMQVSSSFLCGNTGNIVVESQAAVWQEQSDQHEEESSSLVPLSVEWRVSETSSILTRSFSSTNTNTHANTQQQQQQQQQPHLTIRLPKHDEKLPSVPLSKMNRDCNVVKKEDDFPPSLDESETSSKSRQQQQQVLEPSESASEVRGASVVWSSSGAGMPDIIELHVSLNIQNAQPREQEEDYPTTRQQQQRTTHAIGIAYLVFFGSDMGTTVLDLPIKQPDTASQLDGTVVSLEDNASLRVKVSVGQGQTQPKTPIKESFLQDMQRLEPILQQLHFQAKDDASKNPDNNEEGEDGSSASRFLCGSGAGFMDILKTLSGVVKKCDDGEGIFHSTDSMGSTIVTSASLGI